MPAPYPYTSNVSFTEPGTYKYNPSGWGAVTVAAEATAAMSLRGEAQSAYVNTYLDVQWGQAADGYVMRFHWFNTSLAEAHAVEIFKTQGAEPGPTEWNPPRWTRLANSRLTKIWGWVPWEVSVANDRIQMVMAGVLRLTWDLPALPALNDAPLLLRSTNGVSVRNLAYADAIRMDRPVACPAGIWAASYANLPAPDWNALVNRPALAASNHTHAVADVTGLQSNLDARVSASNAYGTGRPVQADWSAADSNAYGFIRNKPNVAAAAHAHAVADVTGLQAALDGKAASNHAHAIAQVSGLQSNLDARAADSAALSNSLVALSNVSTFWRPAGQANLIATASNASAASFSLNGADYADAVTPWYGMVRREEKTILMGYGGVHIGTALSPSMCRIDLFGSLTNANGMVNNLHIGDFTYGPTWRGISHMSSVGAGKYALLQSETGETLLNCAAGQNIGFRCANADKAYMNSDGCFFLMGSTSMSSPGYGFLNSLGNVGRSTGTNPYGLVVSARVAAGEFNATSDARVKEEVAAFRGDLCLDLVKRLAVRHYKYRPDGHYKVGVVAQEVERVFPNCVSQIVRDDVPDFRVVDYNQLTALLLGAVQELSRRVEESRPQS